MSAWRKEIDDAERAGNTVRAVLLKERFSRFQDIADIG